MTAPTTVPVPSEPTHPCLRCGRPVAVTDSLCETCNPLGLKQPAATQVHAIAAGGIVLFVAILAVLGRVGLSGVGPFSGQTGDVVTAPGGGLSLALTVSNAGSKAAATTCRIVEAGGAVGGPGQVVQTPIVPAGGSITFSASLTVFGDAPRALAADCQSP